MHLGIRSFCCTAFQLHVGLAFPFYNAGNIQNPKEKSGEIEFLPWKDLLDLALGPSLFRDLDLLSFLETQQHHWAAQCWINISSRMVSCCIYPNGINKSQILPFRPPPNPHYLSPHLIRHKTVCLSNPWLSCWNFQITSQAPDLYVSSQLFLINLGLHCTKCSSQEWTNSGF